MEVIVISVCITVVLLYLIFVAANYYNPYTEEIHDRRELKNSRGSYVSFIYHIKRTYKNGKIKYIKKQFDN